VAHIGGSGDVGASGNVVHNTQTVNGSANIIGSGLIEAISYSTPIIIPVRFEYVKQKIDLTAEILNCEFEVILNDVELSFQDQVISFECSLKGVINLEGGV